ncbi:MAG TPA: hypothetical protein VJO52_09885 [Gemmatimonadaceae bacterium]|nr:hypothetical protein [Gemmatimonadaceae bacterium]
MTTPLNADNAEHCRIESIALRPGTRIGRDHLAVLFCKKEHRSFRHEQPRAVSAPPTDPSVSFSLSL